MSPGRVPGRGRTSWGRALALTAGGALWGAADACADDGGPWRTVVTPAAQRGVTAALTGERLCGAQGNCAIAGDEIDLGGLPMVRGVVVDDTAAQIVVPAAVRSARPW